VNGLSGMNGVSGNCILNTHHNPVFVIHPVQFRSRASPVCNPYISHTGRVQR
jgi:hypothetical protein